MEFVGLVFALFTVGYILGVWMACLVFKKPQQAYEDAVTAPFAKYRVSIMGESTRTGGRRP